MNIDTLKQHLLKTIHEYGNEHIFYSDFQQNLTYEDLLNKINEGPSSSQLNKIQLYEHPDLPHKIRMIRLHNPHEIMLSLLFCWANSLTPLILDPHLNEDELELILKAWKLSPSKNQPNTSTKSPLDFLLATSGSTSVPKLIHHSLENAYQSCTLMIKAFKTSFPQSWGLTLPCWHIGGLMVMLRMFFTHARVVKVDLKDKDLAIKLKGVEALSIVPTQLHRLVKKAQNNPSYLQALQEMKLILLGGAACPEELENRAKKLHLKVCLSYGSTETCSLVALSAFDQKFSELNPLPEVTFLSDQNTLQLSITSPTICKTIITEDNVTHIKEQKLKTNDRAVIKDGRPQILGRIDDLYISGGENVSIQKVETFIKSLPGVLEAVVVPRSDSEFGQVAHLYYKHEKESAPLDFEFNLEQAAKNYLAPHERPKSYSPLPHYQELKPQRRKLIEKVSEQEKKWRDHPMILFIHGFMGHPCEFSFLIQELRDKGVPAWKMKTISLPGHLEHHISPSVKSFSQYLEEFEKLISKYLEHPYLLYAYSMGARLVLSMGDQQEAQFEHLHTLILESAHPGGLSKQEGQERIDREKNFFDPTMSQEEFKNFLKEWTIKPLFYGLKESRGYQELIDIKSSSHRPQEIYKSLQLASTAYQPDTRSFLKEYANKKPVIYLSGEKDTKYHHIGEELSKKTKIQHFSCENIGHNIHNTAVSWCAGIILEAWKKQNTQD